MQQFVIDVGGKPFPQLAREFVLDPLGMTKSTYEQPLPPARESEAATAHDSKGRPINGKYHTYPEMAAAGFVPRHPNWLAWFWNYRPAGMFKPATQREMLTSVLGNYGLGLMLGETEGQKSLSHGGANAGFQCMMFAYLSGGRGVIVMTNGDRGGGLASEILRSIAAEYGWPDYKVQEKALATVGEETLRSYTGAYHLPNRPTLILTVEKGHLLLTLPQGDTVEMSPESPTSFSSMNDGLPPLRFARKE